MVLDKTKMLKPAACTTLRQCPALWPHLHLDVLLSNADMVQAEQVGCALAQPARHLEAARGESSIRALV